jgi:hypothetical protein
LWRSRLSEVADRPWLARALFIAAALLVSWLHLFVHGTGIGRHELGLDEAGTWGVAARPLGVVLTLPTEFHSQPPLYYLVLHFLLGINDSPWFLRGFSWLCCLLCVQLILFYLDELTLLARVFLSVLFIYAGLTTYLATNVRPYGMATLATLAASVLLVRLARAPTRRRAIAYAVWATVMLYTMAFNIATFMAHSLAAAAVVTVDLARFGRLAAWRRHRGLLLAMGTVVIAYLPYLFLALHYQYKPNPVRTIDKVLRYGTYELTVMDHFQLATPVMLGLCALWAVGIVGELRERNGLVLLWPLMAVGQIAFVYFFIVGRSPIGPQGKYMMPSFVALAALAAFGVHHLLAARARAAWLVLPPLLAALVWPRYRQFHDYMKSSIPPGPFGVLHREMSKQHGKKVIFFDIGYDGQHLEYVIRNDPDITTATDRSSGWGSGGTNRLEASYVLATIGRSHATTRCYYYYLKYPSGPYATTFVPAMQRLGYQQVPALPPIHGHAVPGFCRT